MSFGSQLRYFFTILFIAASLALVCLSLASYGCLIGILTSRFFLFIVFNTGICVIIAKSALGQTSAEGLGDILEFGCYQVDEEGQEGEEMTITDSSDGEIDENDRIFSDIDDEDENDGLFSDTDDERESDEDEDEDVDVGEYDDLESRVEEFIAKVFLGWKLELLEDQLSSSGKVD